MQDVYLYACSSAQGLPEKATIFRRGVPLCRDAGPAPLLCVSPLPDCLYSWEEVLDPRNLVPYPANDDGHSKVPESEAPYIALEGEGCEGWLRSVAGVLLPCKLRKLRVCKVRR